MAFAKALIGKRKRVWGVGESTYWGAKTRCELRKRFLEKSAKRTNAKRKTQNAKKTKGVSGSAPCPSHSRFANTGGGSHLAYSANGLQHLVSFILGVSHASRTMCRDDVPSPCYYGGRCRLQGTARDMRLREWTCRQCAAFWDRGVFGSPCAVFRARLKGFRRLQTRFAFAKSTYWGFSQPF